MPTSGYFWVTSLWAIFLPAYIFKTFMINRHYVCTKQKLKNLIKINTCKWMNEKQNDELELSFFIV